MHLHPIQDIADQLLTTGLARLSYRGPIHDHASAIFHQGSEFFDASISAKASSSTAGILEGYRAMGIEYSKSPERPDLNESFSVWPRNAGNAEVFVWGAQCALHAVMSDACNPFITLADGVLDEIRLRLNPAGVRLSCREMSYLQLNHYRPFRCDRELLQDAHEDGHLLTFIFATQPGLELIRGHEFEPVCISLDELIVIPSSVLTAMSAGRIPPGYHQVRRHGQQRERLSLMFFVNPSMDLPIEPWIRATEASDVTDVRTLVDRNSGLFGLPTLTEAHDASSSVRGG